jgi:hypothetical protein
MPQSAPGGLPGRGGFRARCGFSESDAIAKFCPVFADGKRMVTSFSDAGCLILRLNHPRSCFFKKPLAPYFRQAAQRNVDLFFRRVPLAGLPADVLNGPACRACNLCLICVPFAHYDEPETLPYAIRLVCFIGADVKQRHMAVSCVLIERGPSMKRRGGKAHAQLRKVINAPPCRPT